ncbi:GTP cyclohydrolase I FolE2 [Candidatus Daviesbacteria bacterium]|nr:GTP cyclohydrolase I FolE2 [Candidatus Daviesbacteria bacterium]
MVDIQNQNDTRQIPLEMVGIKNIALPLLVPTKSGKPQNVTGLVSFYTNLPHNSRGTHMSRFVEVLYRNRRNHLTFQQLKHIAGEAKKKLKAEKAYLEVSFTYLIEKKSPVSKKYSFLDYECKVASKVNSGDYEQRLTVNVPVLLLCPCSKAISKFNAHSQRATVTIEADFIGEFWIEDLIRLIEKEGSCEIYPLLKRADEKYVTERSYDNPKFVEDIVRDIALKLKKTASIQSFVVECESYESIHNHNAYAKFVSDSVKKGARNVNS